MLAFPTLLRGMVRRSLCALALGLAALPGAMAQDLPVAYVRFASVYQEFESVELLKEKVLAPGASSFLIFQPLKPGLYKFFGDFHPETAQGQIVAK